MSKVDDLLKRIKYSEKQHNKYRRKMSNRNITEKERKHARLCNDILNEVKKLNKK